MKTAHLGLLIPTLIVIVGVGVAYGVTADDPAPSPAVNTGPSRLPSGQEEEAIIRRAVEADATFTATVGDRPWTRGITMILGTVAHTEVTWEGGVDSSGPWRATMCEDGRLNEWSILWRDLHRLVVEVDLETETVQASYPGTLDPPLNADGTRPSVAEHVGEVDLREWVLKGPPVCSEGPTNN
jgi:hypothetical protein